MTKTPLRPDQLRRRTDLAQFNFATTAELAHSEAIIGQDRAIEALQFGLDMDHVGYNLYALGPDGTGKHTTVMVYLRERASQAAAPDDWCYVFNFEQPHRPNALRLPPGTATGFKADMFALVEELRAVLLATFTSEEYQLQRRTIDEELRGRQSAALDQLRTEAKTKDIALLQTPNGFAFAPLGDDGEVISPDEFMRLEADRQRAIESEINELQGALQLVMQQMPAWHREVKAKVKQLNEEVTAFTVEPLFGELRQKYEGVDSVARFLQAAQRDVIDNFELFLEDDERAPGPSPGAPGPSNVSALRRYEVNVIVDNSQLHGAPVVYLDLPRYQNLIGRVEHVAQMGALVTDFTLIKPGALHEANGGYLALDAHRLLTEPFAWDGLKRALRSNLIQIESLGQAYGAVSTVSLEPEPVDLSVKVVLIGERSLHYLLSTVDSEYQDLFKVAADFADEMPREPETELALARLVATVADREQLRPLEPDAVARVIEHSSRSSADALKLSTHMQDMVDLLREADFQAGREDRDTIRAQDVAQALDMRVRRASRVEERLRESVLREHLLVATSGEVVGQVNGLSVIDMGGYSFGRPNRITARVRMGKGELIDIERQVDLGGPIHSKGVLILTGYLGQRYAAERPLALSATLVFEQSYSGVEGDSASAAELCALLSALAEVPIKQSLAITGSVNQRGQIQAIGGVNQKVEGFFDLCAARGLTGREGVIIPQANVDNLMLRDDVVEAAKRGDFAVYAVETIDDALELLTDLEAGQPDDSGAFPPDSLNGRVVAKLERFAELLSEAGHNGRDNEVEPANAE